VISELEIAATLDLFEAAPCAYLFTSLDGTITKVNETFLQWTGYPSFDLLDQKKFHDLLTRPSAIFYETHFSPLLHMQGFIKEITLDFLCADGSHLPALVNSKIHKDQFGNGVLILSSIFDIRARSKYERELLLERRQAEQWALVVENTSDAIVTADAESALTGWNRGAEALFGHNAAHAVGRSFRDLVMSQESAQDFDKALRTLRSGESAHYEATAKDKDGGLINVSMNMTPHIEPVDDYKGFSAIIRDIRARKRSEKARQLARDLELANRLAHEINNPLQAVVNCIAIVAQNGEDQYISIAEHNLKRIAQVITDLVAVTRNSK